MANEIKGVNRDDLYLQRGVQKVIVVTEAEAQKDNEIAALEQRVTILEQTIEDILTQVYPNIVR